MATSITSAVGTSDPTEFRTVWSSTELRNTNQSLQHVYEESRGYWGRGGRFSPFTFWARGHALYLVQIAACNKSRKLFEALFKYHESLLPSGTKYRSNAERGSSSHGNVVDLFLEYSSLQQNCK
jgi:hypothetical protein